MPHPNHVPARRFIEAFFDGRLTDDYLADEMSVWTTLGPIADRSVYAPTVNRIMALFKQPGASFEYTIDAITAEDDRVVIEAHSAGIFPDGVAYANTYIFSLRMKDGRVTSICEHFNPLPAMEALFPRLGMDIEA